MSKLENRAAHYHPSNQLGLCSCPCGRTLERELKHPRRIAALQRIWKTATFNSENTVLTPVEIRFQSFFSVWRRRYHEFLKALHRRHLFFVDSTGSTKLPGSETEAYLHHVSKLKVALAVAFAELFPEFVIPRRKPLLKPALSYPWDSDPDTTARSAEQLLVSLVDAQPLLVEASRIIKRGDSTLALIWRDLFGWDVLNPLDLVEFLIEPVFGRSLRGQLLTNSLPALTTHLNEEFDLARAIEVLEGARVILVKELNSEPGSSKGGDADAEANSGNHSSDTRARVDPPQVTPNRARRQKRMPLHEANLKAMKSAGIDKRFIELATCRIVERNEQGAIDACVTGIELLSGDAKRRVLDKTVAVWMALIGCSHGQVGRMPLWKARMRLIPQKGKELSLSDDMLNVLKAEVQDTAERGPKRGRISTGRVNRKP